MGRIVTFLKSDTFIQLIKYGFVGVSGLIVELCLFYLLVKVLNVNYFFSEYIGTIVGAKQEVVNTSVSHIISSIVAIINNFILNSYFTFKVTDKKLNRFIKFFSIALIGLVFSTLLLNIFNARLGDQWIMVSKGTAVLIVAFLQFIFNKFFTFKNQN